MHHELVRRPAAEGVEHPLELLVRPGRRHALRRVEPGEGGRLVDARPLPLLEAVPSPILDVGILQVGVGLDVLGDVVEVFRFPVGEDLLAGRVDDADLPVVEVHVVVLVDEAHVVRHQLVPVAQDELHVRLVLEDDVLEDLQSQFAERELVLRHRPELLPVLRRQGLGHAAGNAPHGVRRPPPDDDLDVLGDRPLPDDLPPRLQPDLLDQAEHVALLLRPVGADDEVGGA